MYTLEVKVQKGIKLLDFFDATCSLASNLFSSELRVFFGGREFSEKGAGEKGGDIRIRIYCIAR